MTITLPNPFIDSLSVDRLPTADQLAAHVDHAAVLSIREAQRAIALPADVVAELDAALVEIVAGVAASSSQTRSRSFASNSTFIPTT